LIQLRHLYFEITTLKTRIIADKAAAAAVPEVVCCCERRIRHMWGYEGRKELLRGTRRLRLKN
jgi:hypothetical protein